MRVSQIRKIISYRFAVPRILFARSPTLLVQEVRGPRCGDKSATVETRPRKLGLCFSGSLGFKDDYAWICPTKDGHGTGTI
jgi:hypothetical protein